ncbi:MAG: hypothetical protein KME20_00275 [Kaiparowitsia implicata GSE-PSE-MK54-09C]|nr:hypothetical protein [Kaiparowitsia implicata GSE-PSE-MK54-09C]
MNSLQKPVAAVPLVVVSEFTSANAQTRDAVLWSARVCVVSDWQRGAKLRDRTHVRIVLYADPN